MDTMRDYRDDRYYRDEYDKMPHDRNYRYGKSYRDRYGRNYRTQNEYYDCLEDIIEDGMELARAYEDVSEMASNSAEKNKLMKIAEREKEHYRTVKEMMQNHM